MTENEPDPRAILVTGGASGLGAAMVRHFTAAGHQVAVADINRDAGRVLAEATGCLFVRTDVGVLADNQAAAAEAAETFGGLDAVCLNAGVAGGTSVAEDFDPERYRYSVSINLDGAVYGANATVPYLRARGGGAILITSSLAGIAPSLDLYYSAAKHALVGLARSLAMVLYQDHIRVNAVCPGFVDTPLIAPVRDLLTANGIAVADAGQIAAQAAGILDSPGTGQAWEVQAGRPPALVSFPDVTLSRIAGHEPGPEAAP
jgi:NAD(P)-dependent dehydrogenase (short-subunit alcohol dehydrogenase family)